MKWPTVPRRGIRKWLKFAREMLQCMKTMRPVAGAGITINEIKGGGTLISAKAEETGGQVVTTYFLHNGVLVLVDLRAASAPHTVS